MRGAQPGDAFFFHFSGHGSRVKDTDGDEADGWDETICPVDYDRAGMIVDDVRFVFVLVARSQIYLLMHAYRKSTPDSCDLFLKDLG